MRPRDGVTRWYDTHRRGGLAHHAAGVVNPRGRRGHASGERRARGRWEVNSAHSGDPRSPRTLVKSLRRKLRDDSANPAYIFTEPGMGYQMAKPETDGKGKEDA